MGNIGKKISTNDREKQAYAFYLAKGWSPLQSAAIVGNLLHESGLNPSSEGDIGYKGGSSRGIAQFRGERLKRLKTQYGDNWNDFGNQLEFVNWELNNTHKSAGDALKKTNDIYDAGRIVSDKYEIPAVKFNANKDRQNKVFNTYNKLSGVSTDYANYVPNPIGASSSNPQKSIEIVETPNFIPNKEVVNIDLEVPSQTEDTFSETKAKEEIARVTTEQQILEDYFAASIENQQQYNQLQSVPEVEQFPDLIDQYTQVSSFIDSPIAQQGGATRQDSINIRNSSIKFKDVIKSLGYKVRSGDSNSYPEDKNNLYIFKDGKIIVNRNIIDKEELKENTNTRKNGDVYLNSNVDRTGGKNTKPETIGYNHPVLKKVNSNQYETTEQTSFLGYNKDLPTILMDGRIKPQQRNQYDLKGGERNPDYVVFNEYDLLAITPFDMLSEKDKKERIKKYGRSGVPESYGKDISKKDSINTRPKINSVETLQPNGLIVPTNKFNDVDIKMLNQYIKPKYWDIQDSVNQNFGGYQENYRVNSDNIDYMLRELAPEPFNSRKSIPYYQQGGATRQDSLNLYNNSRQVENFYRKQKYNMSSYDFGDEYDIHEDQKREYKKFKENNSIYVDNTGIPPEIPKNTFNRVSNSLSKSLYNGMTKLGVKINPTNPGKLKDLEYVPKSDFRKDIDSNRYLQREVYNNFINKESPMQLFDKRIYPKKEVEANKGKDFVKLYSYNSIGNKPFDLLNEDEKKERVKLYGRDGVPKSYLTPNNPINPKEVPINSTVTKMPNVEALDSLKQKGLIPFSNSELSSSISIPNQYIQPKYWDVQDNINQNFGGYQQNYRVNPETADLMLRELAPEPYNSRVSTPYYQNGGTIGNLSPEQTADVEKQRQWSNYWNSNRVIDGQKINSNSDIPFSSDIYVDDLNYGNNNRETTLGEFDNVSDRLILDTNYQSKPGIPVHEFSHRYQKYLNPDTYNQYINKPITQVLQQTQGSSEYHGNVDENQAELNRLRYNSGFKPDQVITPQNLQSYNSDEYNLKHFSQDQLINLLNSTAYNNTNDLTYAQQGGQIPVSSNGVYDFPMQEVIVPTKNGNITMKNVNYPIIGVDEYGNQILMMPGQDYQFPGKVIHEIPQLQQYFNKK